MKKETSSQSRKRSPRQNEALTKRKLAIKLIKDFPDVTQEKMVLLVHAMLDHLFEALSSGQHIEFRDFGVLEVQTHKARIGRNPRRPEDTVTIPARKVVKFKPSKKLKLALAKDTTRR